MKETARKDFHSCLNWKSTSLRIHRTMFITIFLVLVLLVSPAAFLLFDSPIWRVSASHIRWSLEVLDGEGSDRTGWHTSIAVDSNGNPHISYLYHTGIDLMYTTKSSGKWKTEALDTAGSVGWDSSIALDSNGDPHIAYIDHTNRYVKYVTKDPAFPFPIIETVDQSFGVHSTSIAVDKIGRPHIAYFVIPFPGADHILKHAVRDGGTWNTEEIDSGPTSAGHDVSLALDSNDSPHIVFILQSPGELYHAFEVMGTWYIELAISGANLGLFFSLAIDFRDDLHLSYIDRFDGVRYAVKRGAAWSKETIGHPGLSLTHNSIAADSSGNPHVCYNNRSNDGLTYGTKVSGVWIRETVDAGMETGAWCSIATDQSNLPHVSYYDVTHGNLMYATIVNGTWNQEVVDKGIEDDVGRYSSIALDAAGRPHISYFDDTYRDLKYIYEDPMGSWCLRRVDEIDSVGWSTSIAIDSTGNPHFSYFDMTHQDLKYARGPGYPWFNETVDSAGSVGFNTSIAIGLNDSVHIAYYDYANGDLKYANNTLGNWSIETVDSVGDVGVYPSLVIDSKGWAHIGYFNASSTSLKYAFNNGGVWSLRTIDSSGDVGYWTSISLNSTDEPRISYYDSALGDLKYAYSESGIWNVETADSLGDVGLFSSLDIDPNDKAHIAFYDRTHRDLRYATDVSGSWESEVVAFSADVGQFASIAVSSTGNPHISYYDRSNGNLNYAFGRFVADLVITPDDISLSPSNTVVNGTLVQINASVTNLGWADAFDVIVRFFDGVPVPGNQIGSDRPVSFIAQKGGRGQAYESWIAGPPGNHEICVVVDPDDFIEESDESNNQACVPVEVLEPPPPRPPSNLSAVLSGQDLQNVTLTWDLSPDDGAGSNSVLAYDIYRNTSFDSQRRGYALHDAVPSGTKAYIDVLAGEGDPANYFYFVCAVGSSNDSSFSANQAAKFTRPLSQGQNLISIPLIQSNESTETVLQTVKYDKAWFYDASSQEWKWYMTFKAYRRGLFSVDQTMGVWVNITQDSNLTVAGVVPAQTTIHLDQGWNLVSFPSFNSSYTVFDLRLDTGGVRVEGNGSLAPYYLRVLGDAEALLPGYGYWVRVDAEVGWIIEVS